MPKKSAIEQHNDKMMFHFDRIFKILDDLRTKTLLEIEQPLTTPTIRENPHYPRKSK